MAKQTHVTPEEIVEMHHLYDKLGTYAAVGRELGRSASTVAKYIKMDGVSQNIKIAVENLIKKGDIQ